MIWFKVNQEDISSEYSDAQLGALIRYQALITRLRRLPTDKEIHREINKKNWISLKKIMSRIGVDLKLIESRTIVNRRLIDSKREVSRKSSRKFRNKLKCAFPENEEGGDDIVTVTETECDRHGDRLEREREREMSPPPPNPRPQPHLDIVTQNLAGAVKINKFLKKRREDALIRIEHIDKIAVLYTQMRSETEKGRPGEVLNAFSYKDSMKSKYIGDKEKLTSSVEELIVFYTGLIKDLKKKEKQEERDGLKKVEKENEVRAAHKFNSLGKKEKKRIEKSAKEILDKEMGDNEFVKKGSPLYQGAVRAKCIEMVSVKKFKKVEP